MKKRNGFVSNSSSSSFIVIGENSLSNVDYEYSDCGEYQFGWQERIYRSFNSKLNWAILIGNRFNKDLDMIAKVYRDFTGEYLQLEAISDFVIREGYIDHGSVELSNAEMFESEDKMKAWLFYSDSAIYNDNDNH